MYSLPFTMTLDPATRDQLSRIEAKLDLLLRKEIRQMATLQDVLSSVTDERTRIDGLVALTSGLAQQLKDALQAGGQLTPEIQAQIDAVFGAVESNKAAVQAAIDAGTPAAPAG